MSGFYPGYPAPPGSVPPQQIHPDAQNRAGPPYNPSHYSGPPTQPGMGFVPPPVQSMNPPSAGFAQSGKGFPHTGVAPPPMYNLNSAMNDMSLTGPGNAPPPPNHPGVLAPNAPVYHTPGAPQFMAPPVTPSPNIPMHGQLQAPAASQFYAPVPSASQVERRFSTGEGSLGMLSTGSETLAGADAFHVDNIDTNIKVPTRMLRFTSNKLPATQSFANSCKLPLGGIIRPLSFPETDDEEEVDVIQPGAAGIVRCKRCRTYINPFVSWIENGRRWRCNICAQLNECPSAYFCHLDPATGQRRDTSQRPELCKSVVEWIAPSEYMVRPPQPPAYFFIFDVSGPAIQNGMLAIVSRAVRKCLDEMPGGDRTMIGFITYDTAVHYYLLKPGADYAQMLVVGDLNELFVPAPVDLLVNLKDSRKAVENFLDNLPSMFSGKPSPPVSCLGPALKAAFTVMKAIGGKMVVFQSVLPTLGDGALKPRGNPNLMGTPEEVSMLRPSSTWYKDTAIEFSRCQIAVDLFLFPQQFIDCSTLSELPKLTAGSMFTYLAFNAISDGPKLESQLCRTLTQPTIFEAVLRIRCTKGMKINNYYGNFFVRGTDLLALPNCNADSTFGFDIVHDEQSVNSKYVSIQSALLYTSSDGERRIRVASHILAVTNSMTELMASVDTEATISLMARQTLEMSVKTNLDSARNRIIQTCADIFRVAKEGDKRSVSGYVMPPPGQPRGAKEEELVVPKNLELLPLFTLGLLKNVAIRGGTDVHPDERIAAHMLINEMFVDSIITFIHPKLFTIHNMDSTVGTPARDFDSHHELNGLKTAGRNHVILPHSVNLSIERLSSEGIFLLDNGNDFIIWVGRASSPAMNNSLFGVNSLEVIGDLSQLTLNRQGNDTASRLDSVLQALRESNLPQIASKVIIIREGDAIQESRFFWQLIEDRAQFNGGTYNYSDFMQFMNKPATSQVGMAMTGPNVGPKHPPPGVNIGHSPSVSGHPSGPPHMPPMSAPGPGQMPLSMGQPVGTMPPPHVPVGHVPSSQTNPSGQQAFLTPPPFSQLTQSASGGAVGPSIPSHGVLKTGSVPSPLGPPINMNPTTSFGSIQSQPVNRMPSPPVSAMQQHQVVNASTSFPAGSGTTMTVRGPPNTKIAMPPMTEPAHRGSRPESFTPPSAPPSLPSYGHMINPNASTVPPGTQTVNVSSPLITKNTADIYHQPSALGAPPAHVAPSIDHDYVGSKTNLTPPPPPTSLQQGRALPPPPAPFLNPPYPGQQQHSGQSFPPTRS